MKTREKIERKDRRALYISLFIVFIMVISVIGFIFGGNSDEIKYKYNKYLFTKIDNGWLTIIGNKQIAVSYGPRELENISMNRVLLNEINNAQKMYISFNPDNDLERAVYEFQNTIFPFISTQIVKACTDDVEGCEDKVIKNCEDANVNTRIISFRLANESSARYDNYCLDIKGNGEELIRVADRVILTLFGV